MRPYLIIVGCVRECVCVCVCVCVCMEFLSWWNLVIESDSMTRFHQDRNSKHTHTTDDNDIRPHTAQEHNEPTSTELNLVTA